jgi:OOP family OmpA-OmpF porin
MRRHRITVVLAIIGIGFASVWPSHAQSRQGPTDFRGQTYSVDDLDKALFPDAQPPARLRGIAPSQQPAEPPPVIVPVLFKFNSDKILPESHSDLEKVGQVLTRHPNAQIRIEGHTDSIGTESYNLSLSRRRAESVQQYLVRHFSIAENRLIIVPKGESDPIASNDTSDGRDKNRRVAFVNLGN